MKLFNLAYLFLFTACGAVAVDPDPESDPASSIDEPVAAQPGTVAEPTAAPEAPLLLIEAPRIAMSSNALSKLTIDSAISGVIRPGSPIFVVEQRIVTTTDQQIMLAVDLPTPTGTFARTVVSDVIQLPNPRAEHVLCTKNGIKVFDTRCGRTRPATRVEPRTGAISASQWRMWVVSDTDEQPLTSCITAANGTRVECVLPGQAGVAYRVMVAASGFTDLWDGTDGLGQQVMAGFPFTGAISPLYESHCWDWSYTATAEYCETRYDFTRFTAIDTASLAFDPITIELDANGQRSAMASPALTWDAGDDDLPGTY